MLAVPFASQARTIADLRDTLTPGQILIDATVPLATAVGGRPTQTVAVWAGSAAQQAQALVPDGVRVVSALHTVAAASLADLDHALEEDVLVCGDRAADKQAVAGLLDRIPGLRCVDAGRLEMSRVVEQLTA
ncbi:MAG: 8-hydroxy-5-deazaflavin:NADPH oxidoreductase, partial [Solirubrobacteraceae bacterium]|nr:8-hydroxy-5-deazaflavin:NADPH oxidoreductase [Solirubrobacteraceae bacterium]